MKTSVLAVIPARLGSTRFYRKVIHPYHGKPLIYYIVNEARKAHMIDRLVVATDSREIARALNESDVEVMMTSAKHRTGSDRTAEIMNKIGGDIIINIQADNFGLKAAVLDKTIEKLKKKRSIQFATLARRIRSDEELFNPDTVKVMLGKDGFAHWFSRLPLPYLQNTVPGVRAEQFNFYAHVGVYFFRREALTMFARWKRSPLEKAESLEQLRILENGHRITVFKTKTRSVSVDTPKDLKKIDMLCKPKR